MTLNEKQIQAIADKHGVSRTEVEQLIKTNDFTENRDFTDDGRRRVDGSLTGREIEKVFKKGGDIKIDLPGPFSYYFSTMGVRKGFVTFKHFNKGNIMKDEIYNVKLATSKVLEYQGSGNITVSDFTDDANLPVSNKLIRLLDQVLHIIDRQKNRLELEIAKMNDAEWNRLYRHPFITEFKLDMLP